MSAFFFSESDEETPNKVNGTAKVLKKTPNGKIAAESSRYVISLLFLWKLFLHCLVPCGLGILTLKKYYL